NAFKLPFTASWTSCATCMASGSTPLASGEPSGLEPSGFKLSGLKKGGSSVCFSFISLGYPTHNAATPLFSSRASSLPGAIKYQCQNHLERFYKTPQPVRG